MKNSKILIPVVVALLVSVGGFFAGMQYQKSKGPSLGDFQGMRVQFGEGNRPTGVMGVRFQGQGRPVSGEIIDSDAKSITVKLTDGSSRIVFVGESTKINKMASGAKEDLSNGTEVLAIGSENSDGSITATSIQINRLGEE